MSSNKTMKSWPKAIHSAKDLPEVYVPQFEELTFERFPYSILVPHDKKGKEDVPESLISLLQDSIMVFENKSNTILPTRYRFEDIIYIEFGVILLYSWIKIHGIVNGEVKTSNLVFNSVQDELFHPIINAARKSIICCEGEGILEEQRIEYLKKLNLKLYNYTKRGMLPGQTVLHSIYQPQIKETLFKLFNKIKSETSVSVLTRKELIIIHEPEKLQVTDEHKGAVWQYIPLKRIKEMFIKDKDEETLKLVLRLNDDEELDYVFSNLNLKDLEELRAMVKELK